MFRSSIVRVIAPAVATLGLLAQPAWAAGTICWNPDELPAARLHAFHTALMVGAMRCPNHSPDVLDSYNAFVDAREATLEASRTVLQARFIRALGPEGGVIAFAAYDTEIGNRASIIDHDVMRCDAIATYSRLAAAASEGDLYTLARVSDSGVAIRACEAEPALTRPVAVAAQTARQEEEQAPPETVQALAEAPQTRATLAQAQPGTARPPTMHITLGEPESDPEAAPEASPAESRPASAEPEEVDAATALEDAARALAAAASSLREKSAAKQ